ncbi:hypothetical protein ABZ863_03685 [Saccharomonospora sp. NPDC046836]
MSKPFDEPTAGRPQPKPVMICAFEGWNERLAQNAQAKVFDGE